MNQETKDWLAVLGLVVAFPFAAFAVGLVLVLAAPAVLILLGAK